MIRLPRRRRTIVRVRHNIAQEPFILLEDPNGEVLANTEPYTTNYNARRAATSIQSRLRNARIVDELPA